MKFKQVIFSRWTLGIILAVLLILLVAINLPAQPSRISSIKKLPKGSLVAEKYYQQALRAKAENNPKKAEEKILPAYYSDPQNVAFLEVYSWAEFRLGNYQKAIQLYQDLIKLSPTAAYYNYLGNAWREAGYSREAIKSFEAAIEKNYQFKTAYQNLVNVYKSQYWANKKDLVEFLKELASNTDNKLAQEYLDQVLKN